MLEMKLFMNAATNMSRNNVDILSNETKLGNSKMNAKFFKENLKPFTLTEKAPVHF